MLYYTARVLVKSIRTCKRSVLGCVNKKEMFLGFLEELTKFSVIVSEFNIVLMILE
jgi:hypothetical protein